MPPSTRRSYRSVTTYPVAMLPESTAPWAYALAAVVVVLLLKETQARRKRLHLPPGPAPLPLVGNVLDMPKKHLGVEFLELTRRYGK